MAFCSKCGAQLAENATFCPVCGQQVTPQNPYNPNPVTRTSNEKIMSILSYIGILVLVPIFAEPNNPNVRFHANQGLVLFLIEAALGIINSVISAIFYWNVFFFISLTANIVFGIVWIALVALAIYGIVNAANGQQKELPVIGSIRILK